MSTHPATQGHSNSGAADPQVQKEASSFLPQAPPMNGSQYHNIIEEQIYAEQPPTAEEQKPWRIFHPDSGKRDKAATEEPTISLGPDN